MRVGVLALQGCIDPHTRHLEAMGAEAVLVKLPQDLATVEGLILPGGESTTMTKLAKPSGLWEALQETSHKIPFWGVCAGAILMARQVENPAQESLNVMDVKLRRNAYGRQKESFQTEVQLVTGEVEPAVFIRAPKFLSWGSGVKVQGRIGEEVAFLDDGFHLMTAFHPELTTSHWFHRLFLERIRKLSGKA
jgi:5'-phosphate synthase pdxT subunit